MTLTDSFRRTIRYLRLSVTDRCDFRCLYCLPERVAFLPKRQVLSLEELDRLSSAFIALGVRKLRLTGGEPLVRRGVMTLVRSLSRHLTSGALEELTLTTNGNLLAEYAAELAACGVRRINVSIDTLDPALFARITRSGRLDRVLDGLRAARAAGLQIKINTVALREVNERELSALVGWCGQEGYDLTLIEVMPMGEMLNPLYADHYLPLSLVQTRLAQDWTLNESGYHSGGPARYVEVRETGRKLGFITPLSHNFCESCNRVRVTCTGVLHTCLGQDDDTDLRTPLRSGESDDALITTLRAAISHKPRGHDFVVVRTGNARAVSRHMNMTGG
ncbi:GTP 3',8-cyclase [uncultured Gammaproteobacteria bacterium]